MNYIPPINVIRRLFLKERTNINKTQHFEFPNGGLSKSWLSGSGGGLRILDSEI